MAFRPRHIEDRQAVFGSAFEERMPVQLSEMQTQWQQVRSLLRMELGETTFSTWLRPLELGDAMGDRVVINVPTQFMRDWIVSNYADRIRSLWSGLNPTVRSIALHVRAAANGAVVPPRAAVAAAGQADPLAMPALIANNLAEPAAVDSVDDPCEGLGAQLDKRLTFETFVVGKPNEFAVAAAERVAEQAATFNPLFLYGGVGLGKTHLMHAIAWRVKQKDPSKRVVYLSAEKFMYQFVRALRSKETMQFKELFRSVDLLMVDDVQFISDKDSTQEEFFHTFNALVERGRQIVISADRSPSDLSGLEERIRSRLSWGLVADIHPTTYELRLGILQAKAEKLGADVPLRVIEFLASRITSNVRELEGALNRIVHHAMVTRRPLSIEIAQETLKDVLRAVDRRITIEEIQRAVVEHYGLKLADMTSARRSRAVARPRQVAMYLAKGLTPRSLPEIGRKFGGRDHTTVLHAVKQIEKFQAEDQQIAEDLAAIRRRLQA